MSEARPELRAMLRSLETYCDASQSLTYLAKLASHAGSIQEAAAVYRDEGSALADELRVLELMRAEINTFITQLMLQVAITHKEKK